MIIFTFPFYIILVIVVLMIIPTSIGIHIHCIFLERSQIYYNEKYNLTQSKVFNLSDNMKIIYGWIDFANIENHSFHSYSNFSKCQMCNFSPHNHGFIDHDDSNDLIVSFLIGKMAGVIPFIQSLRTTGSKAQIAIFVDTLTLHTIHQRFGSFMDYCGVNLIEIGDYQKVKYYRHIYYIKYLTAASFLSTHNQFNRILITDVSDVIFQGNPFLTPFPHNNTFIVSPEFEKNGLNTSHWNTGKEYKIIRLLAENKNHTNTFAYHRQRRYYNGGIILTTQYLAINHTLNVINILNKLTTSQWNRLDRLNIRVEEQNVHNFAINEYLWKNKSIKVISDGPNHEIFMLWGRKIVRGQKFPDFKYKGKYVLLFHLTYIDKKYCKSIKYKCPPIFKFKPYYRC
ncbi:hypothetical protein TRFO_17848 [Tritrichomonas foetus]|uniref:Nucleotide-diphospho-sugar transferase domain-containing protein n=1 Tax=Tritrichomonas foetus TaxID=1144522 RepID=A0A1J4KRS4_9EUKA|nr:hypothetical protein TRFO_17848 [Tritrichomonas foetus]|eukprot:OHT12366.1 hypothetical protein TRFO_17848 [Tritrichomonas foetus]